MIYWQLFWTFLKIGAFTLGGGYAMIPLIQREVVDNRHWMDEATFLDVLALAQSAPGVMAVNTAFFVGYMLRGWRGVVMTILGAILPSFLIVLLIAMVFTRYRENATIEAIFRGIRPAVVALIVAPLFRMTQTAFRQPSGERQRPLWLTIALALVPVVAVVLIWWVGLSPIYVILAAILIACVYTLLTHSSHS